MKYSSLARYKVLKNFFREVRKIFDKFHPVECFDFKVSANHVSFENENYFEDLFIREIVDSEELHEPLYIIKHNPYFTSLIPLIWAVSVTLRFKLHRSYPRIGHGYFSHLFNARYSLARKVVRKVFPEIPLHHANQIALAATFDSLGFYKLYLFFIDDDIEEIFLDMPNTPIYIDHSKLGRCKTNVILSKLDVDRIIAQLKAESGLNVDISSPSLKTDLITKLFHLRISVDVPPLTVDGPSLIFRRFKRRPLTIIDLVRNGTVTSEAAAYIIFCLFNRRNILVIGEPASGKTTFVNALDMITPPHWRKVTVESVVESVKQILLNKHQVRFRVDPIEKRFSKRRKIYEVEKLLHRSPNYIFLGEILTSEHTKALFNALAAGLRGLQTCHANSPESLLIRWVIHHGIPVPCLVDLDLIILMKHILEYKFNQRYVYRVSELSLSNYGYTLDCVDVIDVFRRGGPDDSLKPLIDLYESPVVSKICLERSLSRERFLAELSFYRDVIDFLSKSNISSPKKVSSLFAHAYALARNGIYDYRRFILEVNP